jgi:hypothetical protein
MNLLKTLQLLRVKEKTNGKALEDALWLKRHYDRSNQNMLHGSEAFYLPSVNTDARIKWGTIFTATMFKYFGLDADDEGPNVPIFLVTIVEKSHLTTERAQNINFRAIQRKLSGALRGLSYIGMIEPGYYNAIYDEVGKIKKNLVSWHGHFLVWNITRQELERWKRKITARIERVMPQMCPVHIKAIQPEQFGHRLWYINKSPCKEYSIGKRREPDENGLPRYKQNSRLLRPGHRVKLFHMLRDVTLPELAMAGGDGRELMRRIKYEALREYRRKNGRK